MINKNQPLWWTLVKMILSFFGANVTLWLAGTITYWTVSDLMDGFSYQWYAYLMIIALYLFGAYLVTVFILGIITLIRQNKEA